MDASSRWQRLAELLHGACGPMGGAESAPSRFHNLRSVELLDCVGCGESPWMTSPPPATTPANETAEPGLPACQVLKQLTRLVASVEREHRRVLTRVRTSAEQVEIELSLPIPAESRLLRLLAGQRSLPWILAGYLLRRHGVRVGCVVDHPCTLALRPPRRFTEDDERQLRTALGELCRRLAAEDLGELAQPIVDGLATVEETEHSLLAPEGISLAADAVYGARAVGARVAWVFHLIDVDDLLGHEPSFRALGLERLEERFARWARLAAPLALDPTTLQLKRGQQVTIHPILLPVTSRTMKRWLDARQLGLARQLVTHAVELAHRLNCQVVSLGQFTSIVTRNGRSLIRQLPPGMGLTTGNSYTVCLAIQALTLAWQARRIEPAGETLLVAGAAGNIGQVCAELLAPQFRETILLGSPRADSLARLESLRRRIPRATVAVDPRVARRARVLLLATNSVQPILAADDLALGAVVCDVSVPAAVDANVAIQRADVALLRGGIARLPGRESLSIPGFPLPAGMVFGCLAEGILLGGEGIRDHSFTGSLTARQVGLVGELADRHGVELADAHGYSLLLRPREVRHVDE